VPASKFTEAAELKRIELGVIPASMTSSAPAPQSENNARPIQSWTYTRQSVTVTLSVSKQRHGDARRIPEKVPSVRRQIVQRTMSMEMTNARNGPTHDRNLGGRSLRRLPSPSFFHERSSAVKPAVGTPLARFVNGFALALAVIAGVSAASGPVAAGQSPAEFINLIGTDVLQEMRADVPLAQKEDYFRQLLRKDADLEGDFSFCSRPLLAYRERGAIH
jgi:hypothetical protein